MPDRDENTRPQAGEIESRTATVEVADKRVRGLIPYGIQSRDLGGFTEIIEPTAFRTTKLDELRAVVDHQGVPLGRYPQTLDVEDRSDGLHWSLDPPKSRQDVIEAIERGDMRAGSWRMVVGRDEWRGDTRHVHEIAELRDVTLCAAEDPAYGEAAHVEYRTTSENNGGDPRQKGAEMASHEDGAAENRSAENENNNENQTEETEERSEERATQHAGSLQVEHRVSTLPRGLADEFRSRGWPGERAEIDWATYRRAGTITTGNTVEFRSLAVSGMVDDVNQAERQSAPYGYDQRYVFPVVPTVPVDRATTSVHVLQQTARSLASASNVLRDIDETSAKPETSSTVDDVVYSLQQVASVQTGVPNIYLEQPAFRTVIEQDLRLALDGGLDKLVLDAIAASAFQAPGSDELLVSIRKARSVIEAAGYSPNVLVLRPADAEALDTLVSGVTGADNDYVFQPAAAAPRVVYGMQVRISKSIPAAAVLDSQAFGKLYISPVSLARFEEDAGSTNKSTVRLEGHGVFGVERADAAVRIAAS